MRHNSPVIISVSTVTKKEATMIARELLDRHLVACTQIYGPVQSMFRWTSKISTAKEYTLVCKTLASASKDVTAVIQTLHSYECPVIEIIPCTLASTKALQWLKDSIRS